MNSILQDAKECYITSNTYNLHKHHIYFGIGLRKISDKNGFTCYLIGRLHNQSNEGVHCGNKPLDIKLKQDCQRAYEQDHTRAEFMALIGRNYL